jgi:hypothetical protein
MSPGSHLRKPHYACATSPCHPAEAISRRLKSGRHDVHGGGIAGVAYSGLSRQRGNASIMFLYQLRPPPQASARRSDSDVLDRPIADRSALRFLRGTRLQLFSLKRAERRREPGVIPRHASVKEHRCQGDLACGRQDHRQSLLMLMAHPGWPTSAVSSSHLADVLWNSSAATTIPSSATKNFVRADRHPTRALTGYHGEYQCARELKIGSPKPTASQSRGATTTIGLSASRCRGCPWGKFGTR